VVGEPVPGGGVASRGQVFADGLEGLADHGRLVVLQPSAFALDETDAS
jgi:hypothetical protein